MLRKLSIILLLFVFPALALEFIDSPPGHLPAAPDETFFQGRAPRSFFSERDQNPALSNCRTQLSANRERYSSERREFRSLLAQRQAGQSVSDEAIDSRESTMIVARRELSAREIQCGICVGRRRGPMKLRRPPLTHTPIYYEADSSCQLPTTDTAVLRRAFEAWVETLHKPGDYPKRLGGFKNVDEFIGVRGNVLDDSIVRFADNGDKYRAFIAVPGPEVPNPFGTTEENRVFRTSFSYVFEGQTEKTAHAMTLRFETPTPLIAINRDVFRVSASGAKRFRTRQNFVVRMRSVLGMWHVTDDGFLRYRTVADFGIAMEAAAQLGMDMLVETLFELTERGQ